LAPQATHAAPLVPHCDVDAETQVDPLQHPDGHDVASHTQLPLTHRCPAPQAGPDPQRHEPPAQPSAVEELQALQAAPPLPQALVDVPA
jgi:hypothetical protein